MKLLVGAAFGLAVFRAVQVIHGQLVEGDFESWPAGARAIAVPGAVVLIPFARCNHSINPLPRAKHPAKCLRSIFNIPVHFTGCGLYTYIYICIESRFNLQQFVPRQQSDVSCDMSQVKRSSSPCLSLFHVSYPTRTRCYSPTRIRNLKRERELRQPKLCS